MGFVGSRSYSGNADKLFEDISESALSYRCHMRNSSGSSMRQSVSNDNGQTYSKHIVQRSYRLISENKGYSQRLDVIRDIEPLFDKKVLLFREEG